jgi:hypothetical protein
LAVRPRTLADASLKVRAARPSAPHRAGPEPSALGRERAAGRRLLWPRIASLKIVWNVATCSSDGRVRLDHVPIQEQVTRAGEPLHLLQTQLPQTPNLVSVQHAFDVGIRQAGRERGEARAPSTGTRRACSGVSRSSSHRCQAEQRHWRLEPVLLRGRAGREPAG